LRPLVRPDRLPQGLRAQALLQARRGEHAAALERVQLLLGLCDQVAVPRRDQGAYEVLRAYCLAGLERWPDALAVLEAQRADQQGTQGELLEAIIGTVQALRALHQGSAQAADLCARVMVRCAELHFNRFLLPLPEAAARLIEVGLDQGVVPEFLAAAVHDRRLQPADPTREDWPWRLKVEVLGPLRLWRDGVALSGAGAAKAQRKPLELLRLLAAHGGGPMPQEAVIDELWPSLEADAPKASFEMAVSRLRKLLGLPDLVRVADGQVMLDAGRCWIDAVAFERLCQRGDAASLHRALAIYRAPLLAGQALGGRMRTARERLALRHEQAVRERTQALLAGGDAEPAVALLRSALVHDPLAETLHRGLIEALALQGERAEALACYRRLCDVLRSSLGIGPSAPTERLVAAIRRGEFFARPS
ncbi:MAG: BTAD domain-containing putative transcriptional regulator, partial [Aquabacterium sp.]